MKTVRRLIEIVYIGDRGKVREVEMAFVNLFCACSLQVDGHKPYINITIMHALNFCILYYSVYQRRTI